MSGIRIFGLRPHFFLSSHAHFFPRWMVKVATTNCTPMPAMTCCRAGRGGERHINDYDRNDAINGIENIPFKQAA